MDNLILILLDITCHYRQPEREIRSRFVTGMRFGLMQIKTALSHILYRYQVTPCVQTPVPLAFDESSVLLRSHGEVTLSFNRIQRYDLSAPDLVGQWQANATFPQS